MQGLVDGVAQGEGYVAVFGVFEDFCAVVGYDRDVPHNFSFQFLVFQLFQKVSYSGKRSRSGSEYASGEASKS